MSKTAKIAIVIIVLAVAAYLLYSWNKGKNKPAVRSSTNVADKNTPGNLMVSDVSNGLNPDIHIQTSSTPFTPPQSIQQATAATGGAR